MISRRTEDKRFFVSTLSFAEAISQSGLQSGGQTQLISSCNLPLNPSNMQIIINWRRNYTKGNIIWMVPRQDHFKPGPNNQWPGDQAGSQRNRTINKASGKECRDTAGAKADSRPDIILVKSSKIQLYPRCWISTCDLLRIWRRWSKEPGYLSCKTQVEINNLLRTVEQLRMRGHTDIPDNTSKYIHK